MPDYHIPLLPGEKYHVLSRAVGNEELFLTGENYRFFLSRFDRYISPVADTYCYCLLSNHFHFLVQIKEAASLINWLKKPVDEEKLPVLVMRQFSKLLNSYAKSFNIAQSRKGGLFMDYMRRVKVETDGQLAATAFYIHKNPVHHGYCSSIEEWKWSSYTEILSEQRTKLLRTDLLECFGGITAFKEYHQQSVHLKHALVIE